MLDAATDSTPVNKPRRQRQDLAAALEPLLIDLRETIRITGQCDRTIRGWAALDWKPVRRCGRRLMFSLVDLRPWVEAGCKPPELPKLRKPH